MVIIEGISVYHTDSIPESITSLSAKLNAGKDKWLPLWVHSLDTCGIAELLLTRWLPRGTKAAMANGMTEEALLHTVKAAAIFHDLGKATAVFQTKISDGCLRLRSQLETSSLPILSERDISLQHQRSFPHAAAGEALLLIEGASYSFSEIIGAHHGEPWKDGKTLRYELQEARYKWSDPSSVALWGNSQQREQWQAVQAECLDWMKKTVGIDSLAELPVLSQPAAVLITGLIIMADWIASNETYFPLIPLETMAPDDMVERINKAWRVLKLPPAWKTCSIDDLTQMSFEQFGFAPNAMQTALMQAVKSSEHPGLIILEAPMGLGKTEAALLSASILTEHGTGGIFFGLPTQATANAIFSRIVEWGEKQPETNKISIRLAHGMADLNETFQSLMSGNNTSNVEEDGGSERLVVHEWFRGRKQALLADFVAGTVDQVLMAALRQKHIMLRHLGLCGKTVIIDECHAYDAYMNQYLEMALRWLGRYQTPVILLSATLPAEKRASFMAAYLDMPWTSRVRARLTKEPWYDNPAYPVITWTDGNEIRQQALIYDGQERNVKLARISHDNTVESQAEATVKKLKEALQNGGCAAVVLNTVQRAQHFAEALKNSMPDATILLLHSRFVMPDRLRHETDLLKRMGKKSTSEERNRVVVVGTQVIEQSLDFDADVMVSDLCPMDLLLQRIGRLHRHKQHDHIRPPNLREPQCFILCAGDNLDRGAKAVYGEYLLMRTRALLPERVRLPQDISSLVNKVYSESVPLPEVPDGYEQAKAKEKKKEDELKRGANSFRIHSPDDDFSSLLDCSILPDDEHARAQVRAGDMSLDALLLTRLPSGELTLLPWLQDGNVWTADRCPCSEDARKILNQRVSLTSGLLKALKPEVSWEELQEMLAVPSAWKDSVWLKRAHLLVLDEQLSARLGNLTLKYSEDKGLEWKKEGDDT